MSATTRGAAAGLVIGIVTVLLLQQLGYLVLTDLAASLVDLVIGAVVGAIVFGLAGWRMGLRYDRRHPTGTMPEWKAS